MWKIGKIVCPICQSECTVGGMKDLPKTNYSLLKLHQMLKHESDRKNVLDRYKVDNVEDFLKINDIRRQTNSNNLLKIDEVVHREHHPKLLKLHRVYGNEVVYREDGGILENSQSVLKRYSFNKDSILRSYLGYVETSPSIALLRKFDACKHKYPCSENFLRNLAKTTVVYGFFRPILKALTAYVKSRWNGEDKAEGEQVKTVFDWKYFILSEISFVVGVSVYR